MPIIELNEKNFKEVIQDNDLVLVDFWASWCMPCRMLGQELEQISEEYPDLVIGKVNVDEEMHLAQMHRITSIPHMFIYRQGEIADDILGYTPKAQILESLK